MVALSRTKDQTRRRKIDAAISEIKRGLSQEHGSRLLKAIETLHKAHGDIDYEKGNPERRVRAELQRPRPRWIPTRC